MTPKRSNLPSRKRANIISCKCVQYVRQWYPVVFAEIRREAEDIHPLGRPGPKPYKRWKPL